MAERDLRSSDPEVDRIMTDFQAVSKEFSEVMGQVEEVVGRAESPDGKVKVHVTSSGQLKALHIDPRAMRLGSQELADVIMDLSRRATEDAALRLMEVTRPYFENDARQGGRQGERPRRR